MKRRIVSLGLVAALGASMLSGCGAKKESKTTEDGKTVISMLYNESGSYPYREDWAIWDWIEEETGVTFDLTIVPQADYKQKTQVIFSSGDIPDIVGMTFPSAADVASGILLPISQYEDQMPNFQKYIEDNDLRDAIDKERYSDGNYYYLPCVAKISNFNETQWLVREDIFEKHNIPIPTTLEEVYEAGKQLKELYPQSSPIVNRFQSPNIMATMSSGFDTIAGSWVIGNGMHYDYDSDTWDFAPTTEN